MRAITLAAALAAAAAGAGAAGCGANSKLTAGWKARGFTHVEESELRPLAGNYFVQTRVYATKADWRVAGSKAERLPVLRLYHRPAGGGEAVEVPFPDGHSVDPNISGLFVSPDGDRIMVPGTAVDVKPRPSILNYVSAGKIGPVFEAKTEGRPMAFHSNAAVPLWSADGHCFAIEAVEMDAAGDARWAVYTWRFDRDKIKTFNSFLALGPGVGAGAGSHHFGGWAPSGDRLIVFEGFAQEQYSTGPKLVHHRVLGRDFNRPASVRPVRLYVLDLKHGGITFAAEREGGWMREAAYAQPRGTEFYRYRWVGDELKIDAPGRVTPLPNIKSAKPPKTAG